MKTIRPNQYFLFALFIVVVYGCFPIDRVTSMYIEYDNDVNYEIISGFPSIENGQIELMFKLNINERYFHKMSKMEFTPCIICSQPNDTFKFKTLIVQGETVKGTNVVAVWKESNSFKYSDKKTIMNCEDYEIKINAIVNDGHGNIELSEKLIFTTTK